MLGRGGVVVSAAGWCGPPEARSCCPLAGADFLAFFGAAFLPTVFLAAASCPACLCGAFLAGAFFAAFFAGAFFAAFFAGAFFAAFFAALCGTCFTAAFLAAAFFAAEAGCADGRRAISVMRLCLSDGSDDSLFKMAAVPERCRVVAPIAAAEDSAGRQVVVVRHSAERVGARCPSTPAGATGIPRAPRQRPVAAGVPKIPVGAPPDPNRSQAPVVGPVQLGRPESWLR